MPFMMDDDLDDLFGEDVPVLQSPAPSVPGLSQRIEELSLGGCAQ